jgi:hypothetical protein
MSKAVENACQNRLSKLGGRNLVYPLNRAIPLSSPLIKSTSVSPDQDELNVLNFKAMSSVLGEELSERCLLGDPQFPPGFKGERRRNCTITYLKSHPGGANNEVGIY